MVPSNGMISLAAHVSIFESMSNILMTRLADVHMVLLYCYSSLTVWYSSLTVRYSRTEIRWRTGEVEPLPLGRDGQLVAGLQDCGTDRRMRRR